MLTRLGQQAGGQATTSSRPCSPSTRNYILTVPMALTCSDMQVARCGHRLSLHGAYYLFLASFWISDCSYYEQADKELHPSLACSSAANPPPPLTGWGKKIGTGKRRMWVRPLFVRGFGGGGGGFPIVDRDLDSRGVALRPE